MLRNGGAGRCISLPHRVRLGPTIELRPSAVGRQTFIGSRHKKCRGHGLLGYDSSVAKGLVELLSGTEHRGPCVLLNSRLRLADSAKGASKQ
jgi:hypothetical protein